MAQSQTIQLRNQREGYERRMQESKKTLTAHLNETVSLISKTADEIKQLTPTNNKGLSDKVTKLMRYITTLKGLIVNDDSADDTDNGSSMISRSRRSPRVEDVDD
jgi:uncharacterized membrane-anchored protein YhcB (DUF1043 family)